MTLPGPVQDLCDRFLSLAPHVLLVPAADAGRSRLPQVELPAVPGQRITRSSMPYTSSCGPAGTKVPLGEPAHTDTPMCGQTLPEPQRRHHLHVLCEIAHADRTLMFSSDYPHWDFDDPRHALTLLPAEIRQRVKAVNAVETYGARL